ncbi:MAG: hypothetical protein CVV16_01845 [Gammaproteobacteria bacterium HGW-Gammaproteobacteria-6]|nr:MAG: hypothetical protein CVV16_01845 [Gammaproteobacteria bacterium HGW-Gammaproteobacteria-6]
MVKRTDGVSGPRILESWDLPSERAFSDPRVLGTLDSPAAPGTEPAIDRLPDITLSSLSPWPGRFWRLLLLAAGLGAAFEWSQWSIALWQWQPVAGVISAGLGLSLLTSGAFAWRGLRKQRLRLTALEQLRKEMQQALKDPAQRLALDWLDRVQALYQGTPLGAQLKTACAGLDQSHSADEVSRRLNTEFYQLIDQPVRQLIRREAAGTGMLVATSPWVSVDLLLVIWRNMRMMQRIAGHYGLPVGQLGRWRLARHVLRNIALAGGSELAIGALSDSFLSGLMEKLAARIGQGIGIGLYSSRLGHFTLDICRVVPQDDNLALIEDNRGIVQAIRERLGGKQDGGA